MIGQHIHNVKFDVTCSDGGANGFNYEDGTFSPDEVRERIDAIDLTPNPVGNGKGLLQFDRLTGFLDPKAAPRELKVVPVKDAYPRRGDAGDDEHGLFGRPPLGQNWDGAQTTIQRWDSRPAARQLRARSGTLRTIFTHDHLGPSTHQQAGLYAGLVVEPEGSLWYLPNGERMNQRRDGGPTSWQGYVVTRDPDKSYREFAIEFQDTQLAYGNASRSVVSNAPFDPSRTKTASALFDVTQYPGVSPSQVPAFERQLDQGTIPPVFISQVFPAMGVALTGNEEVTKVQEGQRWRIQVPKDAALNAGATYELQSRNNDSSLFVYTPGIPPGWADPLNALNAPPAGNAASQAIGAPFPQLISAGVRGTYSMNYRNEPVISRLGLPGTGGGAACAVFAAARRAHGDAEAHAGDRDRGGPGTRARERWESAPGNTRRWPGTRIHGPPR